MSRFTLSRGISVWNIAAVLAVGALAFGAYLSIPVDSESFGISARGTIESVDTAMRVIRISHDPVKALGSQAMKNSISAWRPMSMWAPSGSDRKLSSL